MSVVLLALAALVNFLPEHLPGSQKAWEYAAYGVEASCLWLFLMLQIRARGLLGLSSRAACAWGAFEAMERPACRLAFPMDAPPKLEYGQNLCDAAYDLPMSWISVGFALLVAAVVQEMQRGGR